MLKFVISITLFLSLSSALMAEGDKLYPAPIMFLDSFFAHHVLIAEKSTHQLHLYKNEGSYPELIKTYQMVTGKKAGDKVFQGDHRTPEGIYFFTEFLTHQMLLEKHGKQGEIYGVGAFVMDYPNVIDQANGKTGGGIWLHSTNDETRIEKGLDSRGCIVAANKHLIDIAKYIELNRTTVVVVQDLHYLAKDTWEANRDQLKQTVEDWVKAWTNENSETYFSFYHKDFKDPNRGGLGAYKNYKRAVFSNPGKPNVSISNMSILKNDEYALVTFIQNYESKTIKDVGRKTLYLQKDEFYNWRIVSEQWTKKGIPETKDPVAFQPSMRFFKTNNPAQIFNEAKDGNN